MGSHLKSKVFNLKLNKIYVEKTMKMVSFVIAQQEASDMGEQHIRITQLFNAPVDTIFSLLTDHEVFGQIINAKRNKWLKKLVFNKRRQLHRV